MPKRSQKSRFRERLKQLATKHAGIPEEEGKWKVTFTFGGKQYVKAHKLSTFEIEHMKEMCKEHGDLAADQVIWRAAVKGIGIVSENIMAQAAIDYIKENYKPEVVSNLVENRPTQTSTPPDIHVWPEDEMPVDPPSPMDSEDEEKNQ